jgi:hypothetical protein
MADSEITAYAQGVADSLNRLQGAAAPTAALSDLTAAAEALKQAATQAAWTQALGLWRDAQTDLAGELRAFLGDGLPDIPGIDGLLAAVGWQSEDGLGGTLPLGPVTLTLAAGALTVQPTLPGGVVPPAVNLGPFQPAGIAAAIASPIGGALPGGGSILRLPLGAGFAGTLSIPLGPVSVDATAILERPPDGAPAFLAVLGLSFEPPIQLSFGFSLNRVGGIVGVNRAADTDALRLAVRTGAAGGALFASGPPKDPAALVGELRRFFPAAPGRHVIGPTLKIAWLSLGEASLVSLEVAVAVEIPTGRVVVLAVAKVELPVPGILQLRLDMLGIVDPSQSLVSIDASLVDSHVLGIFSVFGDAALRMCWGSQAYCVVSIGGFYPGFNPEPARLPALRRVGLRMEIEPPGISISAEGYFAVTTNTIQFGGRLDVLIGAGGIGAHGFLQLDALVQFRPFHFVADVAAGFDVRAGGFSFGGVRLDGTISGPGPVVVRGRLVIDTFLFDISWEESFSLGGGPADLPPPAVPLLTVIAGEIRVAGNFRAAAVSDPAVILDPRPPQPGVAAVPPTGTLEWSQRRAPLGFPIDRVNGTPLGGPQGVKVITPGAAAVASFSPGSYCDLSASEKLSRPPFETLTAGVRLADGAPLRGAEVDNDTDLVVIVRLGPAPTRIGGKFLALGAISALVEAGRLAPALGDTVALVSAVRESWAVVGSGGAEATHDSATAAHQFARVGGMVAVASADAAAPVDLAGV